MDTSLLELKLPPDWNAVRAAWDPCRGMLERSGLDGDEAYALAMVAQELLENAVKYGAADADAIALTLRVEAGDVTVEVRSQVGVDEAHLRDFDRTVQWIRGHQDPFEAYVERLKQTSVRPYAPGGSGLGLARIAYEGRCALDFYVDAGSILAVSAVYRRGGTEG
jgi:hypothetical protein